MTEIFLSIITIIPFSFTTIVSLKDLGFRTLFLLMVTLTHRKTGDPKPRFECCTMFHLLNKKKIKKETPTIWVGGADRVCLHRDGV